VFGLEKVVRWNPIRTSAYRPDLAPSDFWAFPNTKRSSEARNFEVINGLQSVFEKWV
jgi:hypothetical protein